MKHEYTVDLSTSGINKLIGVLGGYKIWLNKKADELAKRLAEMGATKASIYFGEAVYDGIYDFEVYYEPAKNGYTVRASGEKILFVEFGSGLIGYGHPEAETNGMGPGTYNPSSDNWKNPDGWWYSGWDGSRHTYGNPPNMPMYRTVKELEEELSRVVQEVFSN